MLKHLIVAVALVAVSSCGTIYRSSSVEPGAADGTNVRVVPMTAETVVQANRSPYQPRTLPAVFSLTAGGGSGVRGAGALPDPTFDLEPRPGALALRVPPAANPGPYQIGVGDVVLFSTPTSGSTVEELSGLLAAQNARQGYTVQDDGSVNIPNVGRVRIAGLTIEDAEDVLFQRLVENQFDPTFSLEISGFNARRVSIGGAVGAPAVVPIGLTPLFLGDALAAAGSVTVEDQDFASVRIYRDGTLYQIPLTTLYSRADLLRTRLVDGDAVFVDTEYALDQAETYFEQQISLFGARREARNSALAELQIEVNLRRAQLNEARTNYQLREDLGADNRDYVYLTGEVGLQSRFALPFESTANLGDALFDGARGITVDSGDVSEIYVLRASPDPREFGAVTAWHLNARNAANFALMTRFELRPDDVIFVAQQPITDVEPHGVTDLAISYQYRAYRDGLDTEDKNQMSITPVLLCGGSGSRLWPLSRKSYPKQFVPLLGEQTLFQASASRLASFDNPLVVTGSDFRFIVTEQLAAIGIDPGAILLEPEGRNTAPAVLAAALHLHAQDPDAVMLVCPSDHLIPDTDNFLAAAAVALDVAQNGQLVTFGISPTYAETGYGYLELAAPPSGGPMPLKQFVEKPDAETAAKLVASGTHLWNAGIFMFTTAAIIEAFKTHAPRLMDPVSASVTNAQTDLGFLRLASDPWSRAEDISIDYAVMERATNLSVVPYASAWSDLGGWDAIWRESVQDDRGVATHGNATAIDCDRSLLRSESDELSLVGIGLKNIVAVAMNDAVLIADLARSQDVKLAVQSLKAQGALQAEQFPKDHRPWGWFESLVIGDRFQVKRIVVHPGAALSLQSHHHRAEHWIVVEGTAKVTVNEEVSLVSENQSVYIPLGAVHRMENPGKVPMVLIEVQTGSYLAEDDIIRYEDVYARD